MGNSDIAKKLATALVALIAVASSANAQAVPQIPVESVPDFFRLPIGVNFGEVPAVAVNSQGHIFVYSEPYRERRRANDVS